MIGEKGVDIIATVLGAAAAIEEVNERDMTTLTTIVRLLSETKADTRNDGEIEKDEILLHEHRRRMIWTPIRQKKERRVTARRRRTSIVTDIVAATKSPVLHHRRTQQWEVIMTLTNYHLVTEWWMCRWHLLILLRSVSR
jgi:hypothetical protein